MVLNRWDYRTVFVESLVRPYRNAASLILANDNYHEDRTHCGLRKQTPQERKRGSGREMVVAWPRVGGLQNPRRLSVAEGPHSVLGDSLTEDSSLPQRLEMLRADLPW